MADYIVYCYCNIGSCLDVQSYLQFRKKFVYEVYVSIDQVKWIMNNTIFCDYMFEKQIIMEKFGTNDIKLDYICLKLGFLSLSVFLFLLRYRYFLISHNPLQLTESKILSWNIWDGILIAFWAYIINILNSVSAVRQVHLLASIIV